MAAYKEQYYNLEENEMQELIAQAKSGIGLFVKNPFTRMALMKNKLVKKDHKDVSEIMGRHSLYGQKIWRRRRHTPNNRYNLFPMYSQV